jgi:DNA-binding response OmpR family regulator
LTNPLTVLVVDDDDDAADLLAFALPRQGFVVTLARSFAEAITALEAGPEPEKAGGPPFDVLVADLHLPDGAGYELLQSLSSVERPRVAVIASGADGPSERKLAQDGGFGAHLVKPVDIDGLAAQLRAMAERR